MTASPSAKFAHPRVALSLLEEKPHESRRVLVISASEASTIDLLSTAPERFGAGRTYKPRAKVVEAVARGEMRWVDHNTAAYAEKACGTWQKARSGLVATMQLRQGAKGRHVPAWQRDPAMK